VGTVKQVADRVGLPSRTVRYYDRIGLVRPRERSDAGYRLYSDEDEGKLHFVRQAKALGFSLDEIRQLMSAAESGCCGQLLPELERLLDTKVAEIDSRIAELHTFRERLAAYRVGKRSGCGCRGHSPFCGCLDDAPLVQIDQRR
jgi:MerR family copper efflux transcriptional regulator